MAMVGPNLMGYTNAESLEAIRRLTKADASRKP
jgi:hypothetical protein